MATSPKISIYTSSLLIFVYLSRAASTSYCPKDYPFPTCPRVGDDPRLTKCCMGQGHLSHQCCAEQVKYSLANVTQVTVTTTEESGHEINWLPRWLLIVISLVTFFAVVVTVTMFLFGFQSWYNQRQHRYNALKI
ncbi:uncharacterized protein [Ptychodera flava]|uniref:uncharacterized protein n=1 Tax=Ptychodera flava TaxID=63121 RepID=UPI00396A3511